MMATINWGEATISIGDMVIFSGMAQYEITPDGYIVNFLDMDSILIEAGRVLMAQEM